MTFAIALYVGFEFLITWASSLGGDSAFFARLNDVYFWNNVFPGLARSELWVTIYNPWFSWYLVMYLLMNGTLLGVLLLKELILSRGIR